MYLWVKYLSLVCFLYSSFKTPMPSTGKPNLSLKCLLCKNTHAKSSDIKHFEKNLMV